VEPTLAKAEARDVVAPCAKSNEKAKSFFSFLWRHWPQQSSGSSVTCILNATTMARASDLDVAYVARLARINLTEAEANAFQKQLDEVLKYVEKLRQADVRQIQEAAHALPIFNVFREDVQRDWFTAEQALSNAPRRANGLFIVPKVVE
jgi:aspartyl-tRNA(Asn)/glutamyl-tRNA(Gln) amidotransferase subunit C